MANNTEATDTATQDSVDSVDGVEIGESRVAIPGMDLEGEKLADDLTTSSSGVGTADTGNEAAVVDGSAAQGTDPAFGLEGQEKASPAAPAVQSDEAKHGTEQHGAKAHSHGGGYGLPDSSRAGRLMSFDFDEFPDLTGREEDWRFTPLGRLRGLHSDELTGTAPTVSVEGPDAVVVETVGRDDARLGTAGTPEDKVAANAWRSFTEATVVTIPAQTELDRFVRIDVAGAGLDAAAAHLVIDAKEFSKGVVVIDHHGSTTLAQNVEILVGDSADLTVVTLQGWEDDSVHASAQQAKVGRDATFKHVAVSLGGDLVRLLPSSRYTAPGGSVEMFGLYFADAGQHLEQRLFVDHAIPNCTSRVTYKGALQGKDARIVWVGDVLIRKEAEGTDTYEVNRNLVLTDGARADSVPNLEIETGLIEGAGHASATGRFDDEQLFYLMARGIPEDDARRLVVRGFLIEIVQQIGVPEIEERLSEAIEAELEAGNI